MKRRKNVRKQPKKASLVSKYTTLDTRIVHNTRLVCNSDPEYKIKSYQTCLLIPCVKTELLDLSAAHCHKDDMNWKIILMFCLNRLYHDVSKAG